MKQATIKLQVRDWEHFSDAHYDRAADVLYVSAGGPCGDVTAELTPEGHILRFTEDGRICGITIIDARFIHERDDGIALTLARGGGVELDDPNVDFVPA